MSTPGTAELCRMYPVWGVFVVFRIKLLDNPAYQAMHPSLFAVTDLGWEDIVGSTRAW